MVASLSEGIVASWSLWDVAASVEGSTVVSESVTVASFELEATSLLGEGGRSESLASGL